MDTFVTICGIVVLVSFTGLVAGGAVIMWRDIFRGR